MLNIGSILIKKTTKFSVLTETGDFQIIHSENIRNSSSYPIRHLTAHPHTFARCSLDTFFATSKTWPFSLLRFFLLNSSNKIDTFISCQISIYTNFAVSFTT